MAVMLWCKMSMSEQANKSIIQMWFEHCILHVHISEMHFTVLLGAMQGCMSMTWKPTGKTAADWLLDQLTGDRAAAVRPAALCYALYHLELCI
jgi:hypothetical protein